VPIVIHRAYEGDWTPYTTLAYELSRAMLDLLDTGAHLSAACAEDMTGDIDARATFLGDYRAQMYRQACASWPHSIASRSMPVTTQAPVLLVTGALDPVTPPRFAEAVARNMPNATLLIVPGMAHAGAARCVEEVVAEFVVRGSMQGVDASCVAGIKPPPFITR
jgi:pimeloyl-ACP methyl ester carboxylesterase